jgi:ComF family protein
LFKEIFYQRCLGCGEHGSGFPICPRCVEKLETYPFYCQTCGYPAKVKTKLCGKCHSKKHWDKIYIPYRYIGPIKKLMREIKFNYRISGIKNFDYLLKDDLLQKYDLITDVPSHYIRKVRRFSHPATCIAKGLAKRNNTLYKNILHRHKKTEYQYKLKKKQRPENVKDAFTCAYNLQSLKILLVDDIITTGSTINECSRILKRQGASRVDILALAGGSI